jgi:hypothetical protein
MSTSATPLLLVKIAAIVVMALSVHMVAAGDPSYGSDLRPSVDLVAFAPSVD